MILLLQADNSKTTGCYDILCPGFVQQSQEFALGRTFPGSYYHGSQIHIKVLVSKVGKSIFVINIVFRLCFGI